MVSKAILSWLKQIIVVNIQISRLIIQDVSKKSAHVFRVVEDFKVYGWLNKF